MFLHTEYKFPPLIVVESHNSAKPSYNYGKRSNISQVKETKAHTSILCDHDILPFCRTHNRKLGYTLYVNSWMMWQCQTTYFTRPSWATMEEAALLSSTRGPFMRVLHLWLKDCHVPILFNLASWRWVEVDGTIFIWLTFPLASTRVLLVTPRIKGEGKKVKSWPAEWSNELTSSQGVPKWHRGHLERSRRHQKLEHE